MRADRAAHAPARHPKPLLICPAWFLGLGRDLPCGMIERLDVGDEFNRNESWAHSQSD